jgi:hypothetical protein
MESLKPRHLEDRAMKRRIILFLLAAGIMVGAAAIGPQKKSNLLLLEWAAKSKMEVPPVAIVIELGLRDEQPTSWSGHATVEGAKVVKREGYRFRAEDKLTEPDGWEASSHRVLRPPLGNPALARLEKIATVGVVFHMTEIKEDSGLIIKCEGREPEKITLRDVLGGKPRLLWDGQAAVRRISTTTPIVTAKTEDDFPAAAYGPDGTLWLAYISYTVRDESRRIEQQPLKEPPADFKAFYTPEFADQLFVKYFRAGKWSEPIPITGPHEDLVRCAIAVEKDGTAWVIYSANRGGKHAIYGRPITRESGAKGRPEAATPGPEERITPENQTHCINPVACTSQGGHLWITYQTLSSDGAELDLGAFVRMNGKWSEWPLFGIGSSWFPAITAGPEGDIVKGYDSYKAGDYDIWLSTSPDSGENVENVYGVGSSRFEARPSLCFDSKGRLWIAYEEGPEKWGKDYGALDREDGNPLYNARSVRVVCLQDGKLLKPMAELPTSKVPQPRDPNEKNPRYAYPKIGIDGKGRIWLTYREKFGTRYTSHPGSYWLTMARRLDGDHWSEPIELHHSDGLLDSRPVLLPHPAGGLLVIHNTDGRYTTPETIDNQIYMSYLDVPGDPADPKLVPHENGEKDKKLWKATEEEHAAVKRIRDYRIAVDGKKYRLLRGEFHRHTEISWDGGPDGSLEDMFRYAIDVAALDWIGNTDHDNGAGREYSWWLTQKFSDAYHIPNAFTPMFSYERSVSYPHGHRNCVFAQRGVRTLPRLEEPVRDKRVAGIHADDTRMLYRYLKEFGGICASHTSATGMGTDWRDNDPEVEPVVEIYQGDRMSYEYQGAPRAGYGPKSGKKPVSIGGWEPAGFVDNALLKKGYRLGFESSSDHWSTHISYTIVLAERNDRGSILEALRKRRCYAATDDIIVDLRSGIHLMGEEFKSSDAITLSMRVVGTKPLAKIDILKDSEVVDTIQPGKTEYQGEWTDAKPTAGVHYYYIRVQQTDGELAWASPIWIDRAK